MRMGRKGEDPKKKKDEKVKIDGAETTNIFYADIKDPVERSKAAIKYENALYEKGMKSGNMVSLSSIKKANPTAYKLLSNSIERSKDAYGEIDDYAIDKKYANVSSYKDIYGNDFNPEERKKAIKADKLDEFESKLGSKAKYTSKGDFGYQIKYVTDEERKVRFDKEVSSTRMKTVPLEKTITNKYGKLSLPSEKESPEFTEPSGTRIKTRYIKPKNVSMGEHVASNVKYVAKKALGGTPFLRSGVEKKREALIQGKAGREIKLGKAYFGEFEGSTKSEISNVRKDLKDTKKQMRSAIGEVKKGTALNSPLSKSERIKGYRDEIKAARSGIRTANKASKYLGKLGQQSANSAITEYKTSAGDIKSIGTGKIRIATPGKFQGYADFARSKKKK